MSTYLSSFAAYLDKFVQYRIASGCWNEYGSKQNLKYFDRYCAENFPIGSPLSQEMIDGWCKKRDTENNSSCYSRTTPARQFVEYLRERGLTDVVVPQATNTKRIKYIPHAFTEEELKRFFEACDNIKIANGKLSPFRKLQCPVFFRLLYSSGIRTTEARYLKRSDVDLVHGVLNIRKSKGYDQHYVALHETMTVVLKDYDRAANILQPNRTWFFQNYNGGHYKRDWVNDNFKKIWKVANGDPKGIIPYDLRHNYAIENISSWQDDSFIFGEKLHMLSKSMGHRCHISTLYYFSIVPRLADKLRNMTENGFNEIVPEVWDEEEW